MRVTVWVVVLAVAHIIRVDVPAALVNEFHYDNVSTDTGEFIEILLGPGENIADFSIVLYNGFDNEPYGSTMGSGSFAAGESNPEGFQVFSAAISGLQNGSPDGFVLVNSSSGTDSVEISGGVPQFLSYEGTITASSGVASGLTSTDVGVSEDGATPEGYSLALTGMGDAYDDFSWVGPAPATQGAFNTGQVAAATAVPEPASTLALLGVAAAVAARRRQRRRYPEQIDPEQIVPRAS